MIQLRQMTLARGSQPLLEDVDLQVHDGWRLGLVGANGSGKSSLLAMLRGELQPELGECEVPVGWRIASVLQETPALPQPAIEYVLDGDEQLRSIEHALAEAQHAHDGERISLLHAELEAVGGYAARARAAALMAGLGFGSDDLDRAVAEFSGGWRMRLNLARALVSRADLTLLDEPTNHLDLDAIVWLERWLAGYPGTLIGSPTTVSSSTAASRTSRTSPPGRSRSTRATTAPSRNSGPHSWPCSRPCTRSSNARSPT